MSGPCRVVSCRIPCVVRRWDGRGSKSIDHPQGWAGQGWRYLCRPGFGGDEGSRVDGERGGIVSDDKGIWPSVALVDGSPSSVRRGRECKSRFSSMSLVMSMGWEGNDCSCGRRDVTRGGAERDELERSTTGCLPLGVPVPVHARRSRVGSTHRRQRITVHKTRSYPLLSTPPTTMSGDTRPRITCAWSQINDTKRPAGREHDMALVHSGAEFCVGYTCYSGALACFSACRVCLIRPDSFTLPWIRRYPVLSRELGVLLAALFTDDMSPPDSDRVSRAPRKSLGLRQDPPSSAPVRSRIQSGCSGRGGRHQGYKQQYS